METPAAADAVNVMQKRRDVPQLWRDTAGNSPHRRTILPRDRSTAMPTAMTSFTIATLIPLPLLFLATLFGGWWVLLALTYLALFTFALDEWTSLVVPQVDGAEFPTTDQLSTALAGVHFALLLVVMAGVTGVTGLGWFSAFGLLAATGLYFGQVSNSNAHELIHRTDKRLFQLGMWVYISMLIGHHTSSHRLVHHRYVATGDDPATADMDENFYDYAQRAWIAGFRSGYEMEQVMAQKLDGKRRPNPYLIYCAGAAKPEPTVATLAASETPPEK